MESLGLDEDEFGGTLTDVLRRYIYFIEEKDIETDIMENINQFKLLSNYSSKMTDILKSVSLKIKIKR